MNKVMVIGLGPEYNYRVDDHYLWKTDNTRYASNHGASLISRTLIDLFNADYIDDFDDLESYSDKYELCVIAFATHVTRNRDVSNYTAFVKTLGIKTVAFSLGIQDYSGSVIEVGGLHPSIIELLQYVISSSGKIGVRGPFTATLLVENGFSPHHIVEIGCPTLFGTKSDVLRINKPVQYSSPLIVYHRTMGTLSEEILSSAPILGQDFLDEVIFDSAVSEDQPIRRIEMQNYHIMDNGDFILDMIRKNGLFFKTFDKWWNRIGQADFVIGARLHGCLAALLQGIPAVMLARDVRVIEIARFYGIPYLKYEEIENKSLKDIFKLADFSRFNSLYPIRKANYLKLLEEIGVLGYTSFSTELLPENYLVTQEDIVTYRGIYFDRFMKLDQLAIFHEKAEKRLSQLEKDILNLKGTMRKIPGYRFLKRFK